MAISKNTAPLGAPSVVTTALAEQVEIKEFLERLEDAVDLVGVVEESLLEEQAFQRKVLRRAISDLGQVASELDLAFRQRECVTETP